MTGHRPILSVWTPTTLALIWTSIVLLLAACQAQPVRAPDTGAVEMEGFDPVEDYYVVDCLLPGEVRRMGQMTYLSPRIPVRTTALSCRIRGGEYTAYSRADYNSALAVWQSRAEAGDAEAQRLVGEIFEKGLGTDPDFEQAARWYRLAAEQGDSRAQVNLAYLYEQGLGVEADMTVALNWYRRAAGIADNDLVFARAAQQRLDAQRAELTAALEQAQREKQVLEDQLTRMRAELAAQTEATTGADQTVVTLERLLAQATQRADSTETRLARLRGAAIELPEPAAQAETATVSVPGHARFGQYYALIIGLQHYQYWDPLQSPHRDAQRLAEILNQRYDFDTTILLEASAREILSAINDLRERTGPEDNVLIYFAGHGQLLRPEDEALRRGYWLPLNAELSRTTYWVSNSAINDHLALIEARSVLVIADSCYGGAMSTDPASILLGAGGGALSDGLIELGLSRQARYVMSSGGLHPVLDQGGDEHSVFARALIDVLENNNELMREQDLFARVSERTDALSGPLAFEQRPELRPIRPAGHAAGSFFFVPRAAP